MVSPSGMAGVVNGHMNSVYDCWVRAGIPGARPNRSKITIKFIAADGNFNGVPTFAYEGTRVGGLYTGSCGFNGTIKLAAFPGNVYNDKVLRHELCHHMDMQGPCLGGHPTVFKKNGCCPFWPYISSGSFGNYDEPGLADGMTFAAHRTSLNEEALDELPLIDLNVVSVFRKFEDNTVADVLLINADFQAVHSLALADEWWTGLKNFKE